MWRLNKSTWDQLSSKDKKIFINRNRRTNDVAWSSVIFDDFTGIEFSDGNYWSGNVDDIGRVIK